MASVSGEDTKCALRRSSISNGHAASVAANGASQHVNLNQSAVSRTSTNEPKKLYRWKEKLAHSKEKKQNISLIEKQSVHPQVKPVLQAEKQRSCVIILEDPQNENLENKVPVGKERKESSSKHNNTNCSENNLTNASNSEKKSKLQPTGKSPALSNELIGLKRNQKHIFSGKMDVLTEDKNEIKEVATSNAEGIAATAISVAGNKRQNKRKCSKREMIFPPVPVLHTSPRCMMPVCPDHDGVNGGEMLEAVLYCALCEQTMCYKCAFQNHKEHTVSPIQAAADSIRANLAERKRRIENIISQMRTKRKTIETSNDELHQRIHAQFEQVVQRLRKKEEEVLAEVSTVKQGRVDVIHRIQNHQEIAWGQIDAVLKTQDDIKMLEEYNGLTVIDAKLPDQQNKFSQSRPDSEDNQLLTKDSPRASLNLYPVQDEIEKIRLDCSELDSSTEERDVIVSNGATPRQSKKRFSFKLDPNTAHSALKVSSNHLSAEYVGAERNGVTTRHHPNGLLTLSTGTNPYNSKYTGISSMNGVHGRLKRMQFATILGDSSITQGKQYWEISVNRSMEYRLGVAYKHMQGTKTLADELNCWTLCLTYPDRFSAIHKHHKEYIFVPTHAAANATKVIRIGIFLDYERGVLSFYNASTAAEKRHLYTFRTVFNRPVWPLLSLRQGKLQVLTGLPVPRNLVWKTR